MTELPRPTIVVITTDHVMPGNTNTHGTMFGGDVMALMDKTAAAAAIRFCRQRVVTASTEHIDFRTPIRPGDIVEARAWVIHTGRTSMVVRVDIWDERPLSGERELCTTGYFTFVAVDDAGKPRPVPPLAVRTPEETADWQRGEEIRAQIQARRKREPG